MKFRLENVATIMSGQKASSFKNRSQKFENRKKGKTEQSRDAHSSIGWYLRNCGAVDVDDSFIADKIIIIIIIIKAKHISNRQWNVRKRRITESYRRQTRKRKESDRCKKLHIMPLTQPTKVKSDPLLAHDAASALLGSCLYPFEVSHDIPVHEPAAVPGLHPLPLYKYPAGIMVGIEHPAEKKYY